MHNGGLLKGEDLSRDKKKSLFNTLFHIPCSFVGRCEFVVFALDRTAVLWKAQ